MAEKYYIEDSSMKSYPDRRQAMEYINEGQSKYPGPWVNHSLNAAKAAEIIAGNYPGLDPEKAYIFGCLHDIGRGVAVSDMRHILDGYNYLMDKGFDEAARICITHSFPVKDIRYVAGKWDCSDDELKFINDYLKRTEYDEYDRLIQLCDAIALPAGYCLIEKRLIDVALRHGVDEYTVPRWKGYFDIQAYFEKVTGKSIYSILPGVIENTFDLNTIK